MLFSIIVLQLVGWYEMVRILWTLPKAETKRIKSRCNMCLYPTFQYIIRMCAFILNFLKIRFSRVMADVIKSRFRWKKLLTFVPIVEVLAFISPKCISKCSFGSESISYSLWITNLEFSFLTLCNRLLRTLTLLL